MNKSQHFGYYDKEHSNEAMAQINYHEKFAKLLELKPSLKILDAGCGQGLAATYLAENYNVDVTGITLPKHEVRSGQSLAKRKNIQNRAHFIVADYNNPPFEPEIFDRIYTNESLSHSPDVQATLAVFWRLLKPGGKLVCAEYEIHSQSLSAWAFASKHSSMVGLSQFTPGSFKKYLKKVGFENITESDWTQGLRPSFERIRRIAKPIEPIVKKLKLENHFINTISAKVYANSVDKNEFAYKVYAATKPLKA